MIKSEKILVLHAFNPYLRILTAFNSEKFKHRNRIRILESICLAFGVAMFSVLILIWIGLAIWGLADKNTSTMRGFVVAIPLLLSIIQFFVQFVVFEIESENISQTIDKLQGMAEQSKYF